MHFTIWNVVELSRPVDISSINSVFLGPTIISPKRCNTKSHGCCKMHELKTQLKHLKIIPFGLSPVMVAANCADLKGI